MEAPLKHSACCRLQTLVTWKKKVRAAGPVGSKNAFISPVFSLHIQLSGQVLGGEEFQKYETYSTAASAVPAVTG